MANKGRPQGSQPIRNTTRVPTARIGNDDGTANGRRSHESSLSDDTWKAEGQRSARVQAAQAGLRAVQVARPW